MTNQEGGFHSTSEAVAKLGKMTVRFSSSDRSWVTRSV